MHSRLENIQAIGGKFCFRLPDDGLWLLDLISHHCSYPAAGTLQRASLRLMTKRLRNTRKHDAARFIFFTEPSTEIFVDAARGDLNTSEKFHAVEKFAYSSGRGGNARRRRELGVRGRA
jgi:hypothetical protein